MINLEVNEMLTVITTIITQTCLPIVSEICWPISSSSFPQKILLISQEEIQEVSYVQEPGLIESSMDSINSKNVKPRVIVLQSKDDGGGCCMGGSPRWEDILAGDRTIVYCRLAIATSKFPSHPTTYYLLVLCYLHMFIPNDIFVCAHPRSRTLP